MSLFSSIAKGIVNIGRTAVGAVKSVLPTATMAAVGGIVGGGVTSGAPAVYSGGGPLVPIGKAVLPGAGKIAAGLGGAALGAGGATALGTLMSDGTVRRRRRRRRGISATELKNHARVERFLAKNYKCKHGGTRGTYVRRSSR